MPDRDKDALKTRNAETTITIRAPAGLKPRVREAAKRGGQNVSAFVVAAIEAELQRRGGGTTAPAANVKGGTTARARKPREDTAPATVFVAAQDEQPQQDEGGRGRMQAPEERPAQRPLHPVQDFRRILTTGGQ
jgi:hypothetical protein